MEEKGSPSEGSEITAFVISVADNIERVFFTCFYLARIYFNCNRGVEEI